MSEISDQGVNLPFPKYGVRLDYFQEMIDTICGGIDNVKDLTTTEVCNQYVMPHTALSQSSLCDLLTNQNHPAVQTAQVFISHAWKFKFLDVVNALQHHFQQNPDIIIWFDLFSNNQHIGPTLTFDWWCGTFKTAIHDMQHVVMVLAPWEDPIPLTRAWCLFELYCAAETGCTFEIAMSSSEELSFFKGICVSNEAERLLGKMMAAIRVERSESFKPEDRAMIFKVVEETVGFAAINAMVFEQIRAWVIRTAENCLYRQYQRAWTSGTTGNRDDSIRSMKETIETPDMSWVNEAILTVMISLATLYRLHGRFADCDKYYRLCYEWNRAKHGDNDRQTLVLLNSIAYTSLQQGDIAAATDLYTECIARQEQLGNDEEAQRDVLLSKNSLATCYQSLGKYEKAKELLENCLDLQIKLFGTKAHHHVYTTMSNLATLLDIIGAYSESEKLYLELLEMLTTANGIDHPDTLRVLSNLSTLYQNPNVRRFAEAEPLLRQCIERRKIVLGMDHVDTLHAVSALTVLLEATGRLSESLPIVQDIYKRAQRNYGDEHPLTLKIMHNLALQSRRRVFVTTEGQALSVEEKDNCNKECEALFFKYIDLQVKLVGNDHLDIIVARHNLAGLFDQQGNLSGALVLYKQVLAGREQIFGTDHPEVHIAQHNVAFCLQRLGKYEESVDEHEEVLSRRYNKFGPVYTGTWSTVFFLALAIDAQYPALLPSDRSEDGEDSGGELEFQARVAILIAKRRAAEDKLTKLFRAQLLESIPFTKNPEESPHITEMKRKMHQQLFDGYMDLFANFSVSHCSRIALILLRVLVEMKTRMHDSQENHVEVLSYQYALAKLLWNPFPPQEIVDPTSGELIEVFVEDEDLKDARLSGCVEAQALFFSVWRGREVLLGREHSHVITALCDYAQTLYIFEPDLKGAKQLYEDALCRALLAYGKDDIIPVQIAGLLWKIYESLGLFAEAERKLYSLIWIRDESQRSWVQRPGVEAAVDKSEETIAALVRCNRLEYITSLI